MRIANVQNGDISLEKPKFVKLTEQTKRFELKKGDILTSLTGNVGRVAEIKASHLPAALNQRVARIKPKEDFDVDRSYLLHFLSSDAFSSFLEQEAHGAAQANVSPNAIKEVPFALPPLEEQKRIVSILDEAFEGLDRARENAEANLKSARELFDEQSRRLLSGKSSEWVEAKLSEVCEKITDGTHQTPKYFDEGYIFLSSKNVTSRKIDWENVKYIDEAQHAAMHKRIAPKRGDILLAKNGTTGVAAMVDRDVVFDIYVSLAHLRPLELLVAEFLLYFVNSKMAKEQFNSRLKGQGVPNLHLKEIRDVKISFPKSKTEQREIVAQIADLSNEANNLEALYTSKLQDISDLRQSLLQKAFAGELT